MSLCMALFERVVSALVGKKRLHALYLKLHFDIGGQPAQHFFHGTGIFLLCVQGGADGCEQMGIVRADHMVVVKAQGADESRFQFREEVQRTSQKRHMSPDGLAAGQAGDGLVHHSLEDGGSQILFRGPFIDQGLNVCLGEHAAAGRYGIEGFVIFGIFVQAGSVSLDQGGHLIDERACAACADAVHALFYIAALKINDFGILTAQFNGHVRLRRQLPESGGYRYDFLGERYFQASG